MTKNYLILLRKAFLLACLLIGIGFHSRSQTVHPVTNAGDELDEFIENTSLWEPGDIILLVSEGEYIVEDTINVLQDVTIMGDPELATRPLLTFMGNGFMPGDSINITLKGFDANGLTIQPEDGTDTEHRANLLDYGNNVFGGGDILVEDIRAEGFKMGIRLYDGSWHYYESLTVNKVTWNDFTEWAIDPRLNAVINLKVTNSTFYNMAGFLKNPYFNEDGDRPFGVVNQTIEIDHNTFYNVAGPGNADALLQVNDANDGGINLMFTNNIVSTLRDVEGARPFRFNAEAGLYTITNSVVHNFETTGEVDTNLGAVDAALDNVVTSDIIADAPGFANAEAANFTIPEDSPLMSAGTNGGAIGDPRWTSPAFTPGDGVHRVSNLDADALDEFIENTALWDAGDTVLLVSAGEYVVEDAINILQDITIMADPGLSGRPLLTFWGNGFMPGDSINITLKGFDANGLTIQPEDGTDTEHRANLLDYGNNAFGGGNILVEDIRAEGFGMGIRLYDGSWHHYESLTVNKVTWNDFTDWAIDPRLNAVINLKVTNSTFYDMAGFLKNPYFNKDGDKPFGVVDQTIEIDHNTFYNVAGPGNADALLQVNDANDGGINLMFTNNIVSTLRDVEGGRPFRFNAAAGLYTISNSVVHNFETTGEVDTNLGAVDAALDNVVTSDIITDDPGFADAEAADFTIPEDSPLMAAGTSGGAVGDPRWTGGVIGGGEDTEVLVTEIIVAGKDGVSEITLKGGFLDMIATVLPGTADDRSVTWSVDDESLAFFSKENTLTAKASGTVTVTATANDGSGVTGSMEVVITNQANITSITVSTEDGSTSLRKGETVQMVATLEPEKPDNPNVNWSVDDETLATISEDGVLTALSEGVVTVKAAAEENRFMNGSMEITIDAVTGIEDGFAVAAEIYPNPVGSRINITSSSVVEVAIHNISGDVVFSGTVHGNGSINTSGLAAGIYTAVIKSGKQVQSLKLIKE